MCHPFDVSSLKDFDGGEVCTVVGACLEALRSIKGLAVANGETAVGLDNVFDLKQVFFKALELSEEVPELSALSLCCGHSGRIRCLLVAYGVESPKLTSRGPWSFVFSPQGFPESSGRIK